MMISNRPQAKLFQPKQPLGQQPLVQFGHEHSHVHGPHCKSEHHSHDAKHAPKKDSENPVTAFFKSVYNWVKDFLTGIWQDLFGANQKEGKQSAHANNKDATPSHACNDKNCNQPH